MEIVTLIIDGTAIKARRGEKLLWAALDMVSTFGGIPIAEAGCNSCLACVAVCPVAALVAKNDSVASGNMSTGMKSGNIQK
jgi:predicted molibdopterin-dependent oxidoreductase YjgC